MHAYRKNCYNFGQVLKLGHVFRQTAHFFEAYIQDRTNLEEKEGGRKDEKERRKYMSQRPPVGGKMK